MASNVKHSIDEVKKYFESHGLSLVSTEYVNANTPLMFRCKCGGLGYINFHNFKNGGQTPRCNKCDLENRRIIPSRFRLSLEHVKSYFSKYSAELLTTEYKNTRQKLQFRCSCGNKHEMSVDSLRLGNIPQCRECHNLYLSLV